MGYVILWLSSLAAGLLLVATVAALSARIKRLRVDVGLPVGAALVPLTIGVLGTVLAGFLRAKGIRPNWFAYAHTWTLVFTAGAALLIFFGTRRRGEPVPRALKWPLKKLALGLAASVAIYIVTIAYMDMAMRIELVNVAAEARAIALSLAPPRVPDHKNAALVYERAFEAMGDEKAWRRKTRRWPWRIEQADFDPAREEAQELLHENVGALRLLRRAASMPDFYFECDYARPSAAMRIPNLTRWRNAADLLALDARNRAAKGDMKGALQDVNAIWGIAEHLSTGPGLISVMIALAIDSVGSKALENVLAARLAEGDELRAVPVEPRFSLRGGLTRAWRMEEAMGLSIFVPVYEGRSRSMGRSAMLSLLDVAGSRAWRVFLLPGDLAAYRYRIRKVQELAAVPHWKICKKAEELDRKFAEDMGGVVTWFFCPALTGHVSIARAEASHRLAALALASATFKTERGAYPKELADLVPDYIEAVPIDPFDGNPLRMLAVDGGLVLYSVYENGKDDGGDGKGRCLGRNKDGDLTLCLGSAYEERRLRPALERAEKRKSREGVRAPLGKR